MKQINSVNLTVATIGTMTHFYGAVADAITLATPAALHIETLAPQFATLIDQLLDVQNKQRAMTGTLSTTEADALRDSIIGFLQQYVNAMKYSPKDAEALAARRLRLVLDAYPGLQEMALDRESTQVLGLLRDLGSDANKADVTAIRLDSYLEALSDAQGDFDLAESRRAREAETRASVAGGIDSGTLRRQAADLYRQIVQLVNAFAIAAPDDKITAFITTVNGEILILEKEIATEKAANTRSRKTKAAR